MNLKKMLLDAINRSRDGRNLFVNRRVFDLMAKMHDEKRVEAISDDGTVRVRYFRAGQVDVASLAGEFRDAAGSMFASSGSHPMYTGVAVVWAHLVKREIDPELNDYFVINWLETGFAPGKSD